MSISSGIVSSTLSRLLSGDNSGEASETLLDALGALAIAKRRGVSPSDDDRARCAEGVARGLLLENSGELSFVSAQLQDLAEATAVVAYIRPDSVVGRH